MTERILIPGELRLFEAYFNPHFFPEALAEVTPFLKCQLTYSKGWPARATQDHKMARFGDDHVEYSFRGVDKPVHPWPAGGHLGGYLTFYRDQIEKLIGWKANCCVANTYTPAGDLHPHRDSEFIPELGENPTIVSVSLGETRNLLVYELGDDGKRKKGVMPHVVTLRAGDILVMEGAFDSRFHHAFKPEEDRRTGLRLSLTYRKHV